jgi:hypothetical protein
MFIEHVVWSNGRTLSGQAEDKMQKKELSLATSKVADIRVISGRATAEESNRDLQTEKESQRPRIVSLTVSWCFMAAGLFVALAPMPARADNPIAVLQAQVAALQSQVNTQQGQITALQGQVSTLQTQLTKVQSNKALGLDPFVSVVSGLVNGVNGPHIYFTGANIHIVSGSTTTADSVTGLGNLIIGYDELPIAVGGTALNAGDRGGAHNLVIGPGNRFTNLAFGGLVAGELNTVSNASTSVSGGFFNTASSFGASVSGGTFNTASGDRSSVSGGSSNTASSFAASVSGGTLNTASNFVASVSGGNSNTASGNLASISGGFNNTASGLFASVSGGEKNTASGRGSSVSGGQNNTASGGNASVSGGGTNTASGFVSSVTGGITNTAAGTINTVVIGGQNVTDNNSNSIAPGAPLNFP